MDILLRGTNRLRRDSAGAPSTPDLVIDDEQDGEDRIGRCICNRSIVSASSQNCPQPSLHLTSVTVASIMRAATLSESSITGDPTQGRTPAAVWSIVEANAGIICACLPMLRQPFLRLIAPLLPHSRPGSKKEHGPCGPLEFEPVDHDSEERVIESSGGPPEPGPSTSPSNVDSVMNESSIRG